MSKIGKLPVPIPQEVTLNYENKVLMVKGPKGELTVPIQEGVEIKIADNQMEVSRKNEEKKVKALHGTTRNLINNAVIGVTQGYSKTLKLVGTGFRVALEGDKLNISLGLSHPVFIKFQEGVELKVDGQDTIIISGCDKQLVGQVAADIRKVKPPEPYKGKGIRYEDEVVIKKAGKTQKGEE